MLWRLARTSVRAGPTVQWQSCQSTVPSGAKTTTDGDEIKQHLGGLTAFSMRSQCLSADSQCCISAVSMSGCLNKKLRNFPTVQDLSRNANLSKPKLKSYIVGKLKLKPIKLVEKSVLLSTTRVTPVQQQKQQLQQAEKFWSKFGLVWQKIHLTFDKST